MKALLAAISLWLSANFDLPDAGRHPSIEFAAPEVIADLRQRGSPGDDVVAVYRDDVETIYLPRGWTGATAGELSVLVHEMVHHLQNAGGLRYACPGERERTAYEAQGRWLDMFGSNLNDAFGINQMTLLVRTRCVM